MFNSRQYEWADITAIMGGRDITGLRGIKYSEKIEREPLYAKGRYPHAMQSGNVSYDGEIVLTQSELEGLIKAGGGSLLNLVLDIVVSYGNPSNGDPITVDTVRGVCFTDTTKGMNQGDKFMDITLPFIAMGVDFQVV